MSRWIITFFIVLPSLALSQYVSTGGRFQVDEKKGCASLTVTITNANLVTVGECTPGKPCDMTWGDGSPAQQNVFTHTYTQAGTYTLRVLYQTIGFDEIQITVTPNTQPAFDIFTCSGNEVRVRVTDTNYDAYIINYNDATAEVQVPKGSLAINDHTYATGGAKTISVRGKDVNADDNCSSKTGPFTALAALPAPFIDELRVTSSTQIELDFTNSTNIQYRLEIATNNNSTFQLAQTFLNSATAAVGNLRTDDNYYCFRLGANDVCNNTSTYSNSICSANFDLTLQSNQNQLNWITNTAGITNFSVDRDGTVIGTPVSSPFLDNSVVCKTTYCYQLTSNYANGSQSISLQKCGEAFSNSIPTAVENVTTVVSSAGVDLTWVQDPVFTPVEYSIFRKSGNESFIKIDTESTTTWSDNAYTTEDEYCYRINYADVCGIQSNPGIETCPIRLSATLGDDNSITLNWTDYSGWLNGVNRYIVEKYDAQGTLLQTFNVGSSTTLFDNATDPANQVYRYVVKADANTAGLGQAVSNEIRVVKEPKLYYPTAFTPDQQGPAENEIFKVFGQYIVEFEMRIFNRWGELLFVSNNLDVGWDGNYKGKEQPEGTYAFVASITDLAGRSFNRSGSVVLLRKK